MPREVLFTEVREVIERKVDHRGRISGLAAYAEQIVSIVVRVADGSSPPSAPEKKKGR